MLDVKSLSEVEVAHSSPSQEAGESEFASSVRAVVHPDPNRGDLIYGLNTNMARKWYVDYHKKFKTKVKTIDEYPVLKQDPKQGKKPKDLESFRSYLSAHKKYSSAFSGNNENENARRKCKGGLEWAVNNNKVVHFVLDGVDIGSVINKNFKGKNGDTPTDATDKNRAITGSELRWLYRNRKNENVINNVTFWVEGKQIKPPWDADVKIPVHMDLETGEMEYTEYSKDLWVTKPTLRENHFEEVAPQSEAESLKKMHLVDETAPIDLSTLYDIDASQHLKSFQDKLGVLKDKYSDLNSLIEIGCKIHNAQEPSQTKALTEELISPSFIYKMTKLTSTQTMVSQDYRARSIAKDLGTKNLSETEQIGLKGNVAYIKILKSLIEENKLDGMKVFEALTKERPYSSKPHKEDKVTGYLFTLADKMKSNSDLAYSVSELLNSIAHNDPEKKTAIRTKLLASDSYSSSKISGMFGRPYHDFYGLILEEGKEKNLSTAAKVAGAVLKDKDLARGLKSNGTKTYAKADNY